MRMKAPAISGGAAVLAAALVWYFRPGSAPLTISEGAPVPAQDVLSVTNDVARAADTQVPAETAPRPADAPEAEAAASPAQSAARSPLPGEIPATPMADLLSGRQRNVPQGMTANEQEFATEPVDMAWAPGAEANLLATFAQMTGLHLIDLHVECRSTMCRLQLTQPNGSTVEGGPRPFNVLLDSVGLEPRWMMAIGERGSPMKSVAYLWREGFAPEQKDGQPQEKD